MTPQQQVNEVFERRMKEQDFNMESFIILIDYVKRCIHRYSASNIHITAEELNRLLFGGPEKVSYFESGVLLQLVKGAPLESFSKDIKDQIAILSELEKITLDFNEFAESAAKSAEREVSTKLRIMS